MAEIYNTSLKWVAGEYAKLLDIKVTTESMETRIEENPYYPSLLSLCDTFSYYNIENIAIRVPGDEIEALEAPFIAYMSMPQVGKDFVIVTGIYNNVVSLIYKNTRAIRLKKSEFLERFDGIAFIAEAGEQSGDPEYSRNIDAGRQKLKRNIFWALMGFLCGALLIYNIVPVAGAFSFWIILALKLCGISVIYLLLLYELDKNNKLVKNVCTVGSRLNCDAVLNSGLSRIGGISWSEIGFLYFVGSFVFLLMPVMQFYEKTRWLAMANLCALPYIVFSLYYQWMVVKQWCLLCLSVIVVLFSEFIWAVLFVWFPDGFSFDFPAYDFNIFSAQLISLLLPMIVWVMLKQLVLKSEEGKYYRAAYSRFLNNPDVFYSLLKQQNKAHPGWEKLGIDLGSTLEDVTIIKVCNPYCNPCAKSHPFLEKLIQQKSNIKLKIIFTSKNNEHDSGAKVVKHLLSIAEHEADKVELALSEWYSGINSDYDAFVRKFPLNHNLNNQSEKLVEMSEWCKLAEITHTPTFFINGYRIPESYKIEDLKNIF